MVITTTVRADNQDPAVLRSDLHLVAKFDNRSAHRIRHRKSRNRGVISFADILSARQDSSHRVLFDFLKSFHWKQIAVKVRRRWRLAHPTIQTLSARGNNTAPTSSQCRLRKKPT